VPKRLASDDREDLLGAERDIRNKLGDRPLDFDAMAIVSNIYRAANRVRTHMERTVLTAEGLSWAAFVALWVLWVWGDLESGELADEVGVSRATLTGVVTTLERKGLVERREHAIDGRRVIVAMTAHGQATIERVFPAFNAQEREITDGLTAAQRKVVAPALRAIQRAVTDDA
jgi:MarR family transcriptional regulator, organic hydroperoxide resistance regulator